MGLISRVAAKVYESPFFQECMHSNNCINVALKMSSAGRGCQVDLGVHTVQGNHEVAVLFVYGWSFWWVLSVEKLRQRIFFNLRNPVLVIIGIKPLGKRRCRHVHLVLPSNALSSSIGFIKFRSGGCLNCSGGLLGLGLYWLFGNGLWRFLCRLDFRSWRVCRGLLGFEGGWVGVECWGLHKVGFVVCNWTRGFIACKEQWKCAILVFLKLKDNMILFGLFFVFVHL